MPNIQRAVEPEYQRLAEGHLDELENAMLDVVVKNMSSGDEVIFGVAQAMRNISKEIDRLRKCMHLIFVIGGTGMEIHRNLYRAYLRMDRLELELLSAQAANIKATRSGNIDGSTFRLLGNALDTMATQFDKFRKIIDTIKVI